MAQSTTSGTTSTRRHLRDLDTASLASSRYVDPEWEANESVRQRELEEARGRAAQMEKTMRWWSDCTANWREKWSKVRNERNKAREETKQLRAKLDMALKDTNIYKKEKQDVDLQNIQLKREIEKIHILLLKHAGQFESQILEALGDDSFKELSFGKANGSPIKENGVNSMENKNFGEVSVEEYVLQGAVPKINTNGEGKSLPRSPQEQEDAEHLMQKLTTLQLRLEETTKTLQVERDDKSQLHQKLDKLNGELNEIKEKCEEYREARQEAVKEMLNLQDQHQEELRQLRADLQDETTTRDGMDRRINDLRAELERLQAENAAEWGKRERIETEKITMERENKKLRTEVRDLQERMERKGRPNSNTECEFRDLQQELIDKNKEIVDLKHTQNKLKKMIQDKITELAHSVRRGEQYETEVKKLRSRIEELKRDLTISEDNIDTANNAIRKLQRTNDELQEQVDNYQVQLQHLHTSDEILNNEEGGEAMATLDDNDCNQTT